MEPDFHVQLMSYPDRMQRCLKVLTAQYLEGSELKPYHVPFLYVVGVNSGISQKGIGARIPVDKSRVSTVIREMMGMGLIANGSSGRTWSLSLTESGRAAFDETMGFLRRIEEDVFGGMEDREALVRILDRLETRVDEIMGSMNGTSGQI